MSVSPPDLDTRIEIAVQKALRAQRRKVFSLLGALTAVALVVVSVRAVAVGTCAQTLPAPLATMCPNEPATADDVNANFQALATTLAARTGALTAGSSITTPSLTVTGTGRRMFTDGTDLILDNDSRRNGATGAARRALVHSAGDVLSVNFGGDYTGGVALAGPLAVSGATTISGTATATGPVHMGCPTTYPIGGGAVTMVDLGVYCVTQSPPAGMARGQANWLEANQFCVERGLRMCSFAELSAAARLGRITTYPFAGGTRDTWVWIDQTASDSNAAGFGGCHVKVNPDHPGYTLGEANCAIDGLVRNANIEGHCCF